jgi:general secretion pathway protein D
MNKIKIWALLLLLNASATMAMTLNLKNTDIVTLINTVSKVTGKNFIIDPRVKGRINVISASEINNDELYNLFLSILKVHGYIAVEGENFTKILPQNKTKNASAINSTNASDVIMTTTIRLKNSNAIKIIPIIRPLMSQHGHLAAYDNSLVVTDTEANIQRLRKIIDELNKNNKFDFEIVKLKYAVANPIAKLLNALNVKNKNDLTIIADDRTNNLILSGIKEARLKTKLLIIELDKKQEQNNNNNVIYLKYANAKEILPTLQNISKAKKDIILNIQADEATNALIISGSAETVKGIKDIIAKLDIRRPQVLIEAIIAEISSNNKEELGFQLLAGSKSGLLGIANFNSQLPSLLSGIASNNPTTIANSISKGGTFVAGDINKARTSGFGFIINALNSLGNTNILSTPSVVTLNNTEAEIVVGREVPFITNSEVKDANPFQNYERKDVGLTLKVKPQINQDGSIKLDIQQEVSSVEASANAVDTVTSKRKLKTSVRVEDKKMLILGGLMDETEILTENKVPILGDIPILGTLFTYETKTKSKRNLLIFIRTTILNDSITNEMTEQKYNYINQEMRGLKKELVSKEEQEEAEQEELPPWMRYDE